MKTVSLILIVFLMASCTSRKHGWDKKEITKTMNGSDFQISEEEAMGLWKKRDDKQSLERALEIYKELHAADPKNVDIIVYLTRGYYLLADSHTNVQDDKIKFFEKAISYGEVGMSTNDAFKAEVKKKDDVEKALSLLTDTEVPVTYWTAASLGKWSKLKGMSVALKYRSRIRAMMKKVEAFRPDYFHGGVARFWGAYYGVMPKISGGNINRSKDYFMKSIQMSPDYLGTKVLLAEVYYVKRGNKKEFKRELESVIAAKEDTNPELAPENILEKRKAKRLLDDIKLFF